MYIDNISSQIQVFLYSVGFGFILGFFYDLFRIIRVALIRTNKAVTAQDILYFLLSAVITFMYLLVINNGKMRFNILLALFFGFTAYYFTLGRFVLSLVVFTAKKFKHYIISLAKLLTTPYRLAISLFGKSFKKMPENFKNIKKSRKKAEKTLENKD